MDLHHTSPKVTPPNESTNWARYRYNLNLEDCNILTKRD